MVSGKLAFSLGHVVLASGLFPRSCGILWQGLYYPPDGVQRDHRAVEKKSFRVARLKREGT